MRVTKDNGDYFELTESIDGVKVEFFKLNVETHLFDLEIELNYDDLDDAMKALDSFDCIEDLVL